MESVKHIETLLEKYFEATTTVAEEKELRAYFSREGLPAHLQEYQPLFQYTFKAGEETYTKALPSKPKKKRIYDLRWVAVAAVAVISFGIFFPSGTPTLEDQYSAEELAAAQKALELFGSNFSKGTEGLTYLSEFERNTNRFLPNE